MPSPTLLWYARFKSTIKDFPHGLWLTYTFWQFSSEILAQKAVPRTKPDMNINVYNGSVADLRAKWPITNSTP